MFLAAHSFSRATLLENCSLLGTDNVHRQISQDTFAQNGGYLLELIKLTGQVMQHWCILNIAPPQSCSFCSQLFYNVLLLCVFLTEGTSILQEL